MQYIISYLIYAVYYFFESNSFTGKKGTLKVQIQIFVGQVYAGYGKHNFAPNYTLLK